MTDELKFTAEYIANCREARGGPWLFPEPREALTEIERLQAENARLAGLLHDEMSQLEIETELANKRWVALNEIYTNGEKHNPNWCKRKAQEGLGFQ